MHDFIDIDKMISSLLPVIILQENMTSGFEGNIYLSMFVIFVNVLLKIVTILVKIRFIRALFLPSNAVMNLSVLTFDGAI